jgi:hypothetical protein
MQSLLLIDVVEMCVGDLVTESFVFSVAVYSEWGHSGRHHTQIPPGARPKSLRLTYATPQR